MRPTDAPASSPGDVSYLLSTPCAERQVLGLGAGPVLPRRPRNSTLRAEQKEESPDPRACGLRGPAERGPCRVRWPTAGRSSFLRPLVSVVLARCNATRVDATSAALRPPPDDQYATTTGIPCARCGPQAPSGPLRRRVPVLLTIRTPDDGRRTRTGPAATRRTPGGGAGRGPAPGVVAALHGRTTAGSRTSPRAARTRTAPGARSPAASPPGARRSAPGCRAARPARPAGRRRPARR